MSSTPSAPSSTLASAAAKRRPSSNRAVAALQEAFPVVLSPSPIIRRDAAAAVGSATAASSSSAALSSSSSPLKKKKKITRYSTFDEMVNAAKRPDPLAKDRERLADFYIIVQGRTTLLKLPDRTLKLIFQFACGHLKALCQVSAVCKRFHYLTFDLETKVTLIPTLVSTEKLSEPGSMVSLAKHLDRRTRGQHITSFAVMNSKAVLELPRHIHGPQISNIGLQTVISCLPHLVKMDIRGVILRDFSPRTDRLLADLPFLVPQLQCVKLGVQFVRNWEPQWWARMPHLTEVVIGSRREDMDWHDASPLVLHEDVFAMLRSPSHKWEGFKVWCELAPSSFTQLISPSAPFPELKHIAINVVHNAEHYRPMDDPNGFNGVANAGGTGAAGGAGAADKKKVEKPKKGAVEEAPAGSKSLFPVLESCTVADVSERPEFASELMVKMGVMAPLMTYFSVTNTHRTGPSKPLPVSSPTKARRAV